MIKVYKKGSPKTKEAEIAPRTFRHGGNKLFFISLGCPRNRVDTEVMLGILLKAGYEPSEDLEDADYIIINTCGFLEAAREESLQTIGQMYEAKKDGAKIIVTGCMVQTHAKDIKEHFPDIDYLLGSGDVEGIFGAIESKGKEDKLLSAQLFVAGEIPRTISTPSHYAYLKLRKDGKNAPIALSHKLKVLLRVSP